MVSKVEVVVSGVGGIFPKANNLDEFTKILLENVNTTEQPKWIEYEKTDGTLYNNMPKDRFKLYDYPFFGHNHDQALYIDPLTRLFLEKTFEAIVDAGINPTELRGKKIAVLVSSTVSETDSSLFESVKRGLGVTGQARSMLANRISFFFNFNGPSMAMDGNWNSGIQMVQQAMSMITSGMCDSAILGATNLGVGPSVQWLMEQRGFVANDKQAEGYCRSDGIVALYIQRADFAKRNYATLLYANTIFSGSRSGDFIGFDCNSFHDFILKCYEDSGVKPEDIAYLETYGCGLKDIDEKELSVVERIFCKNRSTPFQIGSVKTNIGHAEPVSSLMSLIKIIVAMETGIIPAHINYNHPNSKIPALANGNIEVVTKNKPWTGGIAAINCIGLACSYGHMIVRSNKRLIQNIQTDLPLLLTYSTRNEAAITKITENVKLQSTDLSFNNLAHDVFSCNIPGHLYRGYTMKSSTDKTDFKHFSGNNPAVWFIYSGMGSQWHTMGRDLMKLPIFADAVYRCHNILKPKGINLLQIITDDSPEIFENILNSFVGIAVVQIGLTDVLNAIGIHPDGIIGHSVGELGCAYADKCLTAEQMILSAYYRGKASLDADLVPGMMAAVGMGYTKLQALCPKSIDIACHNSFDSCTISGPVSDVQKFVKLLNRQNIFAKLVNVSNFAYHSRYIKPAAPLLLSYLKDVIPEPKHRSSKWISTSIPESNWHTDLAKTVSPEYLTNNLLSSVHFEECLPFIGDNVVAIEIAPHGLLQAILKRAQLTNVVNVPLTKRETNCLEFFFNSLGQLYLSGLDFNLNPLYPAVLRPVPAGTRSLCSFVEWEHSDLLELPTENADFKKETTFDINLNATKFKHLKQYQVDNRVIVPPALYFGFLNEMINIHEHLKSITFVDVVFLNHVSVPPEGTVSITIMTQPGTQLFEVTQNEKTIVTGKFITDNDENLPLAQVENTKELSKINKNSFYKELNFKGYMFQHDYKLVTSFHEIDNGFKATALYSEDWKAFVSTMLQMHLYYVGEFSQCILLPKYIQRINISFKDLKDTRKESSVLYNKSTGIMESNNGVHITGIKYEPLDITNRAIKIENLKFMKHFDENYQDVEYGLNMCTKIVTQNIGTKNFVIIELKEKYTSKYLPYVQKYLNQNNLDAKTTEMNEVDYTVLNESSLLIISGKFLKCASHIISYANNFFLLCFPNTQTICLSKNYITIAQFSANNNKYYLLKKKSVHPVKVLVDDSNLSYENMQTSLNSWTTELKLTENSRIYFVSRTIPVEGIQKFVTQMQSLENSGQFLRFIFLLDSNAPECKSNSKFYAQIFQQDLVVQVLKSGSWGSFVNICETTTIAKTKTSNKLLIRAINSNNFYKVKYLGLHVKDLTRIDDDTTPCAMETVDFAGTNTAGDRVMGLAQTNLGHCKLATDPIFVWPVPTIWSLCDAATVPYAYTLAYYTLFTVGNISKGDVVLVHAGCSEIGQAALHVAFNYGCTVYTTVATDMQKTVLMKLLPQIDEQNILNSQTTHFELSILVQTNGRGVDVILNCLPGNRVHASKRLLATFGRFVQLGIADMHQYATIGMSVFLKNASFHGVTGQNLLQLQTQDKLQLQEMIHRDMKSGVVKPIARIIYTEYSIDESLRYLRSSTAMGAVVMQVSRCPKEDSYLIYADIHDSWLSLVRWLVKEGAKRIILANITNLNQDFINRFLCFIKQTYHTDIIITKHNARSLDSAKMLANEMSLFGPPTESFIFAMSDEVHDKLFENIDAAFSQNKLYGRMVCILGTNKEKSYSRPNSLPVCNIMWDNTYSLQDVITNLDVILTKEDNVVLKGDVIKENKEDAKIVEDDSLFLQITLKSLIQLGQNKFAAVNIVQLASCTGSELRDVPPVFLVPGLAGPTCSSLRQFIGQLMHPVFCITVTAATLHDDVAHLAQQILQVCSSKVYKLIGISWGGILAIEIAKHLECLGIKIELQLVDGAPRVIQSFTNKFNQTGLFNMKLLKQVIKVDGKNLEDILTSTELSKFDYMDIIKSLTILKNLIEYANFYKPLPNKIIGPTTIILPETAKKEDYLELAKHCDQIQYKIMEGNNRSMLENKTAIDFINDNLV